MHVQEEAQEEAQEVLAPQERASVEKMLTLSPPVVTYRFYSV